MPPRAQASTKTRFWMRLFGNIPTKPVFDKKRCAALIARLGIQISELENQLHASDDSQIQTKTSGSATAEVASEAKLSLGPASVSLSEKEMAKSARAVSAEIQEQYKRSKVDFLRRHVMDYQAIFDQMADVSKGDSYVILDDLYHIRRDDQPSVVDYIHSIAKGHQLWIKIGTIRHRSRWYVHGDPPRGVKLGDDAEEIDLDLTSLRSMP